ncbi:MAG: hypothetical protein V1728_04165 [Candidatus Micrarchaeota archaeon]
MLAAMAFKPSVAQAQIQTSDCVFVSEKKDSAKTMSNVVSNFVPLYSMTEIIGDYEVRPRAKLSVPFSYVSDKAGLYFGWQFVDADVRKWKDSLSQMRPRIGYGGNAGLEWAFPIFGLRHALGVSFSGTSFSPFEASSIIGAAFAGTDSSGGVEYLSLYLRGVNGGILRLENLQIVGRSTDESGIYNVAISAGTPGTRLGVNWLYDKRDYWSVLFMTNFSDFFSRMGLSSPLSPGIEMSFSPRTMPALSCSIGQIDKKVSFSIRPSLRLNIGRSGTDNWYFTTKILYEQNTPYSRTPYYDLEVGFQYLNQP